MRKNSNPYIETWRRRFADRAAESQTLALRARKELDSAVEILKAYGAKRILLFGSLCHQGKFVPGSDIDLAVEGISSEAFNRAAADCMMRLNFRIDLKPIESLDAFFLKTVLEKGEVLYEE